MKRSEAGELLDTIWHKLCKNGIPIDVRNGSNIVVADWFRDMVSKEIEIDKPIGIVEHPDYNACPNCGASVGDKNKFCKICGKLLRRE